MNNKLISLIPTKKKNIYIYILIILTNKFGRFIGHD